MSRLFIPGYSFQVIQGYSRLFKVIQGYSRLFDKVKKDIKYPQTCVDLRLKYDNNKHACQHKIFCGMKSSYSLAR
jgi:hypothetical protein